MVLDAVEIVSEKDVRADSVVPAAEDVVLAECCVAYLAEAEAVMDNSAASKIDR
jgi:hypothetical protein